MKYIEASVSLRLRPSHLLLMIYRYLSGIYQIGDLSALNYLKGFIAGKYLDLQPRRILTVSGHGIGEPEMWFAAHIEASRIDTVSFRLIDTQILQFLRSAEPGDIEVVFSKFGQIVAPYAMLSELASDPGLVPYWRDQASEIKRAFEEQRFCVFSDHPSQIAQGNLYDLIYVSHGAQHFSLDVARQLQKQLLPHGWLAVLMPIRDVQFEGQESSSRSFANSLPVLQAKAWFKRSLESRGYSFANESSPPFDLSILALRRELIRFSVLAPASSVLIGELILSSLYEHITDRARLEVLDETAARFKHLHMSVNEELELYIMEAKS
jgi:hypothetical protein